MLFDILTKNKEATMDKVDFEFKINQKEYNECFAKHILARVYSSAFATAKLCDKPDIWSDKYSHGVEVTTLTDTYYNTLNRYKRIWSRRKMSLEQIVKNQPSLLQGKLGINKHGNIILINTNEGRRTVVKSQKGIASTVVLKLKKLQKYKIFEINDLFIYAPNLHVACNNNKINHAITGVQISQFTHLYNNIFVFTYDKLHVFPMKDTGAARIIDISQEDREYADKFATLAQEKANRIREEKKEQKHVERE